MEDIFNIAGRIHSTSQEEVVTTTNEILDAAQEKKQSEVNQEVGERLDFDNTRINALSGGNYVTVQATQSTTAADIPTLINASGEGEQADTLYRVGFWDGSAYVADKYTEYAWNGTAYVILDVNSSIGEVFDISQYNAVGGTPATYADLTAALSGTNVPTSVQRGGMSIKFIKGTAQSSDNKYIQFRLMSDSWSTDTDKWSFCGDDVLIENLEFIDVKTDSEGKILWAIKTDGSIHWGAGVPNQVIDYISDKISELHLTDVSDIITFLGDLYTGDETLQQLLDKKVDGEYVENPEFVRVVTDNEDKILEGTKVDGTKVIGSNLEVGGTINDVDIENLSDNVNELNSEIENKVDKIEGKSLIDSEYANGVSYTENPEYIDVELDSEEKILGGRKTDGTKVIGSNLEVGGTINDVDIENLSDNVNELNSEIENKVDKIEGKSLIDSEYANGVSYTENPEYIDVELDSEEKILGGRKTDGTKFENVALEVGGHTIKNIEDQEERSEITTDSDGKIISYRKKDGTKIENVGIEAPYIKAEHIEIKNNDNDISNIEYPIFIGKSINNNGGLVSSTNTLVSSLVYASKGDVVSIKDASKIEGVYIYEFKYSYNSAYLTKSSLTTDSYEIINDETKFIRIVGVPSSNDPLMIDGVIYGNSAFVNNVYVIHKKSIYSEFETKYVSSTIPSGWYVSNESEFSTTPQNEDPYENTGEKLTLNEIYSIVNGLANDYPDYVTIETLGYDSSYDKEVKEEDISKLSQYSEWLDENNKLHMPVYKLTFEPKSVTIWNKNIGQISTNNNTLPTICISAGIHSNEPPCMRATLNMLIHICRDWKDNDFLGYLRWNCRIVYIPVANPYSYISVRRYNYNRVNINRNFYCNGFWYDYEEDPSFGDYKGTSPLSEIEAKYVSRMYLENADAVLATDCHTYGNWGSWNTCICLDLPSRCYNNIDFAEKTSIGLLKGLNISGWKYHKLPQTLVNKDGTIANYLGLISHSDIPALSNASSLDINIPFICGEAMYTYHSSETNGKTIYNTYTDCMNEELYANMILIALRNKNKNFINF